MKAPHRTSSWTLLFTLILLLTSLIRPAVAAAGALTPEQAVQRAWRAAQDAGAYQFASDVVQTSYPAPALGNVGRSSTRNQLHLEGDVDLPARALTMRLWTGGGSVANPDSAAEIRMEGERAWARQGGGSWQEAEDFTGGFAPGGDFLAYLVGVKNVRLLDGQGDKVTRWQGEEDRVTVSPPHRVTPSSYTRFAFDLDGPAFANHLRDQLESYLRERGELPLNLRLDSSRIYQQMTGQGVITLDDRGLPLRMTLHMAYPPDKDNQRVEADVTTDFVFRIPYQETAAAITSGGTLAAIAQRLSLSSLTDYAIRNTQYVLLLALVALCLFVLITSRRSRKVYRAVVIAVIFSMVIVPLLQDQQAVAFFERQAEKQAKQEQTQQSQAAAADFKTQMTGNWNPQQDPLADLRMGESANQRINGSAQQQDATRNTQHALRTTSSLAEDTSTTSDTDNDGLSDALEAEIGSDPTLADTDGDGLDDGVEASLGISPSNFDSDGDTIRDNIEVQGFLDAAGRRWYLNPKNPDTNGDGRDDGLECPALREIATLASATVVNCDSDGDGVPDPFDLDDDGDGVPDATDITPGGSLGRDGRTFNPAAPQAFDAAHPFSLKINNLAADKPTLVDIQLRPVNPAHLTYAMNVLDWPGADRDGQVQHAKNTTFATGNAADSQADPRLAYGDMRLIPMLELELNGDSVPLSLTVPAINVAVRGTISATVHLEQNAADATQTDLRFAFADTAQLYTVKVYAGACPATGSAVAGATLSVGDGATTTIAPANLRLTDLADGQHVFKITGGGKTVCQPIGNIVNGPYRDKMIDPAPLQPYGISVREKNAAGTLLAYAPLNVVPDPTGDANVAFQARLIYWPAAADAWQQAQQVRVAWLVQMLTDQCDATGFTPSAAAEDDAAQYDNERRGWCIGHRSADVGQVVQTYDEAWYLTGLAARADLGLDMAVAWEAPASDNDRAADDRLWQLARGLLNSFVIGRDEDDNNARDIGVAARNGADETIQARFDAGGSVPDGDDRRWGIPQNALNVKTFSYPHEDYVGLLAAQETRTILQENFSGYRPIIPTLLFAREETFIAVNLADATDTTDGAVTLDFAGHDTSTLASVSWSPYRHNSDQGPDGKTIGWETYPLSEYWDKLEVQFEDAFRNLPREQNRYGTSQAAIIGEMLMARGLFLALNQGVTNLVQFGSNNAGVQIDVLLLWQPSGDAETDTGIAAGVGGLIAGSYTIIADFVTDFVDAFADSWAATMAANVRLTAAQVALQTNTVLTYSNQEAFLKAQGEGFRGIKTSWLDVFNLNSLYVTLNNVQSSGAKMALGAGSIATFAIGAAAVVGCIAAAALSGGDPLVIIGYAITAIGIIVTVKGTMDAIKKAANVLSGVSQATTVANTLKSTAGKVAIAGLIIGAVVTWAVFAVQASLSDLSYQQMGNLVAQTIGQTIVLVIMFIIGLIPIVGAIIQGIITLIDTLISTLCAVFGLSGEEAGDTDPYNDAGDWLCGGIEGLVGTLLGWLFFASNVMVDMSAEGRLAFDELSANQLVLQRNVALDGIG